MAIMQLPSPAHFTAGIEKRWDEVDPITQTFVAPNAFVSGVPWRYGLDDTVQITVNETGPRVKRRDCSDADFDCNFWLGDAVLVAADPSPDNDPLQAPIRLKFSAGVSAVGAWVGVCARDPFDTSFFDQPLFAAMWIALASDPENWQLVVNADGWTGRVCARATPLTAPFVGARVTGSDRIVEVRFDASLLGNRRYDKLALSELTVER